MTGTRSGSRCSSPSRSRSRSTPRCWPARPAMGDTRRFAERINLLRMQPHNDLSSTGYALANPGQEYLILQPDEAAAPFTVRLEPGGYAAEWFSIEDRQTVSAATTTVD